MDETKVQELENAAEEPVIPEEVTEATAPTDESPEKRIAELESEVLRGEIKIALLLNGVLAERLDEAARLAEGLVAAGKTPQEAAREVAENYPHFLASDDLGGQLRHSGRIFGDKEDIFREMTSPPTLTGGGAGSVYI